MNEAQRAARKILALTISEPMRREAEQANGVHIPEGSTLLQALQIVHGVQIDTGPGNDDGGGAT